jgi:Ser/Thr protein kinase RdoA (MazF antagonist)
VQAEIEAFEHQAPRADVLIELHEHGVPTRAVHNDAKLSNVLLDTNSAEPLCVIDLDTVMPGCSLFDFGEMVRSMAHLTDEDAVDLSTVVVQPELYGAIVEGYLGAARDLLSAPEHELLFDAARILVLENGVRFLTDHLLGDHYFRIQRPQQNLDRARSHLALLASLDAQEAALRKLTRFTA